MPGDEREKLDEASLPRRERANGQTHQACFQSRRCARRVSARGQERKPGEHIGFGVVRLGALPEGVSDQAARINSVAIARGEWSGVSR
jgi:hypothetical protein